MKNRLYIITIVLVATILIGCSGKQKELAENTTKEFFSALKDDNAAKVKELYPNFKNIGSYYKSDKIEVEEVKVLEEKKVSVKVKNSFTNGYGKTFEQTIVLYLEPYNGDDETYIIYDSKGIRGYDDDDDDYTFALKVGAIDKNTNLTDQEVAAIFETTDRMKLLFSIETLSELKTNVTVTSWSWENGYGGSASGKGIVKNNSSFNIPKLKYKLTYLDANDNEITTDDGYVTYDKLGAGGSKSFTFYTSYVGNATRARIELDFDIEMIEEYVVSRQYTGNEYKDFLKLREE